MTARVSSQEPVSPYAAEHLVRRLVADFDNGSVLAAMVLNGEGVVLAHARADEFADGDDISTSILPNLMHFPSHGISIFVRFASLVDQEAVRDRVFGILAESKSAPAF